jgi:hypothetical protein
MSLSNKALAKEERNRRREARRKEKSRALVREEALSAIMADQARSAWLRRVQPGDRVRFEAIVPGPRELRVLWGTVRRITSTGGWVINELAPMEGRPFFRRSATGTSEGLIVHPLGLTKVEHHEWAAVEETREMWLQSRLDSISDRVKARTKRLTRDRVASLRADLDEWMSVRGELDGFKCAPIAPAEVAP